MILIKFIYESIIYVSSLGMLPGRISALITVLLFGFLTISYGQESYYKATDLLRQAYLLSLDLQLDDARKICAQSRNEDPNNLLVEHIDNYNDFLQAFISEKKEDLDVLEEQKNVRIAILRKGTSESPFYYFSQAEIHLQWAIARSKHQQYIRAGWDINRAYKLLKKCQKEYPDFVLADKSLSVIHALIGSISGLQKGVIKLFTALDGSVSQGIEEISGLYDSNEASSIWNVEVAVLRSLMYLHVQRDDTSSLTVLESINEDLQELTLLRYFRGANLQKLGRANEAEKLLCLERKTQLPFYYMDLQCGICRLNELSPAARDPLVSYVENFDGSNYIAEAYQKLAWYELIINEDEDAYRQMMEECLLHGHDELGEDQQALLEANVNEMPHSLLLSARLLYDGGAYAAARIKLAAVDIENLSVAEELEYYYRQGRVAHKEGRAEKAIVWYGSTINLGKKRSEYYACNAALQIAEILRARDDLNRAKSYYLQCLDIDPDTYRSSLHQKAQLGLDALEDID